MVEGVHFLSVKEDWSDLVDVIRANVNQTAKLERIARAANALVLAKLSRRAVSCFTLRALTAYARRLFEGPVTLPAGAKLYANGTSCR